MDCNPGALLSRQWGTPAASTGYCSSTSYCFCGLSRGSPVRLVDYTISVCCGNGPGAAGLEDIGSAVEGHGGEPNTGIPDILGGRRRGGGAIRCHGRSLSCHDRPRELLRSSDVRTHGGRYSLGDGRSTPPSHDFLSPTSLLPLSVTHPSLTRRIRPDASRRGTLRHDPCIRSSVNP